MDNGGNLASFIYGREKSTVKISDSTFINNPPSLDYLGNPITLESDSVLEIKNSEFSNHQNIVEKGIINLHVNINFK